MRGWRRLGYTGRVPPRCARAGPPRQRGRRPCAARTRASAARWKVGDRHTGRPAGPQERVGVPLRAHGHRKCVHEDAAARATSSQPVSGLTRLERAPQGHGAWVDHLDRHRAPPLLALATERREAGRVVVIDRVLYGGRDPAAVSRVPRHPAAIRPDAGRAADRQPHPRRVRTEDFVVSASGASRLARALYGALRDRSLSLPDDPRDAR